MVLSALKSKINRTVMDFFFPKVIFNICLAYTTFYMLLLIPNIGGCFLAGMNHVSCILSPVKRVSCVGFPEIYVGGGNKHSVFFPVGRRAPKLGPNMHIMGHRT